MMFAPSWPEALILLGTVGIGAALVTYLVLRFFVWSRAKSSSLEHIRKHALWTGIIAWVLSSLVGANRAGIYDPDKFDADDWSTVPWLALIAPIMAALAVHAIGQASWPTPKSEKRTAVMEFRRVRDYVEPALGWTVAGVFTLSACFVACLFFAPGFISANSVILGDYGQSIQTHHGRAPGYVPAIALSAALLVLVIGTLLVMRFIASRRSLESLTPGQNKTLRSIGMNRLLRVSATVASGLAVIAGNYLLQPHPDSTTTSWVNWLAIVNVVVLIAMLGWKPPSLGPATDDAGYTAWQVHALSAPLTSTAGLAAEKLSNAATAAVLPAALLGVALGYAMRHYFGLIGIVTMAAVFMLLAYLALELLLQRNYAKPGAPPRTVRVLLPWPMYLALAVAAAGLVLALLNSHGVAASGGANSWDGLDAPAAMCRVPAIAALTILVVAGVAAWIVLSRPGLDKTPATLDRALRRRSLFRLARTLAGAWFAILGMLLIMVPVAPDPHPLVPRFESGVFGVLCNVIAALVAFYPMRRLTQDDFTPAQQSTNSMGG